MTSVQTDSKVSEYLKRLGSGERQTVGSLPFPKEFTHARQSNNSATKERLQQTLQGQSRELLFQSEKSAAARRIASGQRTHLVDPEAIDPLLASYEQYAESLVTQNEKLAREALAASSFVATLLEDNNKLRDMEAQRESQMASFARNQGLLIRDCDQPVARRLRGEDRPAAHRRGDARDERQGPGHGLVAGAAGARGRLHVRLH